MKVLLVEDDPNDVLFFTRAWRSAGCPEPPVVRADGEEALAYLGTTRPDAVILDLKLPKLSGLEVLDWIRSRPSLEGLKVYVLTSSGEPSDVRRAAELGASAYLTKPASYDALLRLVRDLAVQLGIRENALDFAAGEMYSDSSGASREER